MNEFNIKELEEIINSGNFESLIGKFESDFLDCKQQIYDLSNDVIKAELAKDVSSFANSNGGYILIGLKTQKSEKYFRDEITEIKSLEQNLINAEQYSSIIRDWIYPVIEGLKVEWKPSNNNINKGIGIIYIPPQKETLKPFLVKRVIDKDKKYQEIIFGYIQRKGERSEPKKIQDIHLIMRDGLLYGKNIDYRFSALESLIKDNLKHIKEENEEKKNIQSIDLINKRINFNLHVNDMNKGRAMVLAAYLKDNSGELQSVFSNSEGSIKKKLENPSTTRYDGWNLATLDSAKIIEGRLIRVMNGDRKTIDLYKDGTLIFAGSADGNFLGWKGDAENPRIHSLALIEVVYNFISFYKEVINDFNKQPITFSTQCWLINLWLDMKESYIIPGPINSISYKFGNNKKFAPNNEYLSDVIDFKTKNFNVGEIAYKIVERIYLWFGIPLGGVNIPYTKQENSSTIIDVKQIKNIK